LEIYLVSRCADAVVGVAAGLVKRPLDRDEIHEAERERSVRSLLPRDEFFVTHLFFFFVHFFLSSLIRSEKSEERKSKAKKKNKKKWRRRITEGNGEKNKWPFSSSFIMTIVTRIALHLDTYFG
jgi:hypothetical protein